jgi:hypothetical protein
MGPAAAGLVFLGLGAYLMANKKRNVPKLVAWLFLLGGGCWAIAGVGLLMRGVGWALSLGNNLGSSLLGAGIGAGIGVLAFIVLCWHAFADMSPKKGKGNPDNSTAFAALFVIPVIVGLGGLAAAVSQAMEAGGTGWSSVSSVIGG